LELVIINLFTDTGKIYKTMFRVQFYREVST